jgi:geranylgeranyl pyrophosphate synthase
MLINATTRTHVHLDTLSTLFGRFFQIRDDYQNLVSADVCSIPSLTFCSQFVIPVWYYLHTNNEQYANQKGFTEDLDEGKYSLPLLHLLHAEPENMQIRNILSTRRALGKLTQEQKVLVLESMKRANSLAYTRTVLRHLHKEIGCEIQVLEKACNSDNVQLKMMWEMLYV